MKRTITILASMLFLSACTMMAFAQMKEGLWEIKTTTEMKGMSIQIPPTTTRTCMSKSDMVPKPPAQGKGQEQECKIKEQKITGDTVSYVMVCSGAGGMSTEISGEMTYKGDSMEGKSTMNVKGPAAMEMTMKMTGKFIGPCTK